MMCQRCGYVQVVVRLGRGVRTLYEKRTGLPHNCDFSEKKQCQCGQLIYFDSKVLSPTGKMIPLNFQSDTYHFCSDYPKGAVKA